MAYDSSLVPPWTALPPWVVLHLPHDSTVLPDWTREQFAVDRATLEREVALLTDHHTARLFGTGQSCPRVRAEASRVVVDVERFVDDAREPMAERGLGVIYRRTSDGRALRHPIDERTRARLLDELYWPHHERLEAAVERALATHGRCLVLDGHSFPKVPLPFEDSRAKRPDICIGTDEFHTPIALRESFVASFEAEGWSIEIDTPFSGALVPRSRYRRDRRVLAVMVEVQRALYMDEATLEPRADFDDMARRVQRACARALRGQPPASAQPLPARGFDTHK